MGTCRRFYKWVRVQGSTSGYVCKVLQVGMCARFYKWVRVQGSTSGYMYEVLQVDIRVHAQVGMCTRFKVLQVFPNVDQVFIIQSSNSGTSCYLDP